jgi:hypothetical protein
MNIFLALPAPKSVFFLPAPNEHSKKWTPLREKLRYKKERYLEGIKKFGTVGEAMEYAGIKSRGTILAYRQSDPEFAQREIETSMALKSDMKDLAEKQLFLNIRAGEAWAIRYFLDRQHEDYRPKGDLNINNAEKQKVDLFLNEIKALAEGTNA